LHFERHIMGADDRAFEMLTAILDEPFAICAIITDADGRAADYRFLKVSACFEDATGFHGVEGRTVREIVPGVEQKWVDHYGNVALKRVPARFTERSAVTGREYDVRAAPIEPPGQFVMVFRDVTEIRRLEAEREQAFDHAQHLLKELGHRVMNSFAAISAILSMEARATPREHRAALERVQGRVQALAALYRRLDEASQVDRIEMADYLGGLVASFRDSLAAPAPVTVTCDFAAITLPTKTAVPLALVVNELLTNAIKHAFGDRGTGTVHVSFAATDGTCRLCVSDDGRGLADAREGSGTGRTLIDAFVGELGGELSSRSGPDGTRITVEFPA
jgi:two-component sensor histidine kinase